MTEKIPKMTATVKVREIVRTFGEREFISNDVLGKALGAKRTQMFSALRNMTRWGELELVRRTTGLQGGQVNVYKAINLAPANFKPKRKPSKEYVKKIKVEPVRVKSVWEDIWPELYQLPQFKKQSVFFTNHCVG